LSGKPASAPFLRRLNLRLLLIDPFYPPPPEKMRDPKRKAPRPLNKVSIEGFMAALQSANPEPKGELNFESTYQLLVAVVLSAQATDVSVNAATAHLFADAPTPEAMVALGEEEIRAHIRTIGLFNTKAKNVLALSKILLEQHGGQVPGDMDALVALPGVGRKSANVVLNIAFGQPVIAVDTHIFRLGNRTGLAPGATPEAVEQGLMRRLPTPFLRHAHHWLILHGRYVCTARKPLCEVCVARGFCGYPDKGAKPD